jgi:hypothetical protein
LKNNEIAEMHRWIDLTGAQYRALTKGKSVGDNSAADLRHNLQLENQLTGSVDVVTLDV